MKSYHLNILSPWHPYGAVPNISYSLQVKDLESGDVGAEVQVRSHCIAIISSRMPKLE